MSHNHQLKHRKIRAAGERNKHSSLERFFMTNKNQMPGDRRYTGKRLLASKKIKVRRIRRRERRLNAVGWSLLDFNHNSHRKFLPANR